MWSHLVATMSKAAVVVGSCLVLSAALLGPGPVRRDLAHAPAPLDRGPHFERNDGQFYGPIRYLARTGHTAFALEDDGWLLGCLGGGTEAAVKMSVVGARPMAFLASSLRAYGHYFVGRDRSAWRTSVPAFERVTATSVLDGVDMVFHTDGGAPEWDLVLAADTPPEVVAIDVVGADELSLTGSGDLRIEAHGAAWVQPRPHATQNSGTTMARAVDCGYRLLGPARFAFDIGAHDPSSPLVIDPTFTYASYLGGASNDEALAAATDSAGHLYIAGDTMSSSFPMAGAVQAPLGMRLAGGTDAFVTEFDPSGGGLAFSVYLGGSQDDIARAVAVDAAGRLVVAGETSSTDFPTAQPFQASCAGGKDAFVATISPSSSVVLVQSTYLGGPSDDGARAVAVDAAGAIYVAGETAGGFPVKNPLVALAAGGGDGFVAKLDTNPVGLTYSTYLGGSGPDAVRGLAVDPSGHAVVTGTTRSSDFPTKLPLQASCNGCNATSGDAFVAALGPTGSTLVFSTFLGGSGDDQGRSIALDGTGRPLIAGFTSSTDFPTRAPARAFATGGGDAFVVRLDASGTALDYATYLGGAMDDEANAIAVDGEGAAYVAGVTWSIDFPTQSPVQAFASGGADGFLTELSPSGSSLVASTYLGGTGNDAVFAVALRHDGSACAAGSTTSVDLPTHAAYQALLGGASDAFAACVAQKPNLDAGAQSGGDDAAADQYAGDADAAADPFAGDADAAAVVGSSDAGPPDAPGRPGDANDAGGGEEQGANPGCGCRVARTPNGNPRPIETAAALLLLASVRRGRRRPPAPRVSSPSGWG
jgi:hypothetical protein